MKRNSANLFLATVLVGMMGSADGQQPPNIVHSDNVGDTAMGTGALKSLNLQAGGGADTAAGANALFGNTSGTFNAAFGFESLSGNTTGCDNTASGAYSLSVNDIHRVEVRAGQSPRDPSGARLSYTVERPCAQVSWVSPEMVLKHCKSG